MLRLNEIILRIFFTPPDTTLETGGTNDLSINDMIDEMAKDDVVPESEKIDLLSNKEEIPKDEEKDETEEKENEEELELEPDEENLESVEDVPRQAILKKYPNLFKEFPQLQTAYYREKKYAEYFPTIDDAKEAVEKGQNYDKFESAVLSGELDTVLSSVKTADEKAYNKMVDNYLPALGKVDQNAYYHVINTVLKNTIMAMVREGDNIKNEDLKAAAVILNQFITGKSDYEAPKAFGPHKQNEPENNERTQFLTERLESSIEDLTSKSSNVIKSTISKHIDPKEVMTDYVKRTAIRDALAEVDEKIASDARFVAIKDRLWQVAIKSNFSRKSLEDIQTAYLNKAKTLLPQIIQKHRNEALKGLGKRVNEEREEPERKGKVATGRPSSADNTTKKGEIPKGMRTIDYLMQD